MMPTDIWNKVNKNPQTSDMCHRLCQIDSRMAEYDAIGQAVPDELATEAAYLKDLIKRRFEQRLANCRRLRDVGWKW